jgi:DNA-binding transcriptional LysR family regulator
MTVIENGDSMHAVDTDLLRTFLAVARRQSFTEAAADLHLVQSTVTSRIQALEKLLGVPLLDRLPDGTRLTHVGHQVIAHAHAVLDAERRLRHDITAATEATGEVAVGAPESVCAYRLPKAIATLRQRHPGVTVHLVPAGTREASQGVLERRFDLGLILDEAPASSHLAVRAFGRESIVLVAAPDHPATHQELTWHDLARYSYFLLEEGCSYSDWFLRELQRSNQAAPQITRFGSIEAARSCVQAGLGLSVLPRIACAEALEHKTLVALPYPPLPDTPLAVVTDERRWQSPAVESVIQTITAAANKWMLAR